MRYLLTIFILSIFIISCTNDATSTSSNITFTVDNDGDTLTVNIDEPFDVSLEQCNGCADIWRIDSLNEICINLIDESRIDHSCSGCVGGASTKIFTFNPVSTCFSKVSLVYFTDTVSLFIKSE